jgi:hypothetical protein
MCEIGSDPTALSCVANTAALCAGRPDPFAMPLRAGSSRGRVGLLRMTSGRGTHRVKR